MNLLERKGGATPHMCDGTPSNYRLPTMAGATGSTRRCPRPTLLELIRASERGYRSVCPAIASMKRLVGLANILRSHQEIGSTDRRIHSARIVSPNHRLDSRLIQNAFGYLSICGGSKCRDSDQF